MVKRYIAYIMALSFILLSGAHIAKADAFFSSSSVTCSSFSATGTVTTTYVAVRIWNTTDGQFEGGPALIDSYYDVGAPTAYFAASGGAFSFTVNFPDQDSGDVIIARIYATDSPTFGAWDGGAFPEVTVTCTKFQGRGIPDGFVLHTISCNAVVYDAAGGEPVTPAATLTAGQTWFVNPTPVVAGGKSWTEVFVSGTTNGFILTSCMQ